jgi:hypothetical protein
MTVDDIVKWMLYATAPAQTLFLLLYGLTTRWWRSLVGRSLFTKALGLALLIDNATLYYLLGPGYYMRDAVRLFVFGLIMVGAWLQLMALIMEKRSGLRHAVSDVPLDR